MTAQPTQNLMESYINTSRIWTEPTISATAGLNTTVTFDDIVDVAISKMDNLPAEDLTAAMVTHEMPLSVVNKALVEHRSLCTPYKPPEIVPTTILTNVLEGTAVPDVQFTERQKPMDLPAFDALAQKLEVPEFARTDATIAPMVSELKFHVTEAKGALQSTKFVREDEQDGKIIGLFTEVSDVVMPVAKVPLLEDTLRQVQLEIVDPIVIKVQQAKEACARAEENMLEYPEEWEENDKKCLQTLHEKARDRAKIEATHKNAADNGFFDTRSCSTEERLQEVSTQVQIFEIEQQRNDEDIRAVDLASSALELEVQRKVEEQAEKRLQLMREREKLEREARFMEIMMAVIAVMHRIRIDKIHNNTQEIEAIDQEITPETGTIFIEKNKRLAAAAVRKAQLSTLNADCAIRTKAWKSLERALYLLDNCKAVMTQRREEYFISHQTELNCIREEIMTLLTDLTQRQADFKLQLTSQTKLLKDEEERHKALIKAKLKKSPQDIETLDRLKGAVKQLTESHDDLDLQIRELQDAHARCMWDAYKGEQKEFCTEPCPDPRPIHMLEVHTRSGPVIWHNAKDVMDVKAAEHTLAAMKKKYSEEQAVLLEQQKMITSLGDFLAQSAPKTTLCITSTSSTPSSVDE